MTIELAAVNDHNALYESIIIVLRLLPVVNGLAANGMSHRQNSVGT